MVLRTRQGILTLAIVGVLGAADPSAARLPAYGVRQLVREFSYATSGIGFSIAAHDFNCDGRADVLVMRGHFDASSETLPVVVLVNDGQGGFVNRTRSVFTGPVPRISANRQVVVADFNGDGRPDVFLVDFGNDVSPFPGAQNNLLLSTPDCRYVDGTPGLPQQSDNTHSAAAGDFDGDGDLDLYIGNFADSENIPAQIWINDGTGRFTVGAGRLPPVFAGVHDSKYLSVLTVDVDRDGAIDLVLGASQELPNAVLRNDGTGHFSFLANAMPPKPLPGNPALSLVYEVRALDLNGDRFPDLLLAYTSTNPPDRRRWIQALVNNGDGTFRDETAERWPLQTEDERAAPYEIVVVDADGDGYLDVLIRVAGPLGDSEPPPFYRNNGDGTFVQRPLTTQVFGRWVLLDVDGDGGRDFFTATSNAGGQPIESHFVVKQIGARIKPGVPREVAATRGAFADRIRVWWPPVWGAAAYEVWRASSPTGPTSLVATVRKPEYDDRSARSGGTFFYRVRARNSAGRSGPSGRASGFAARAPDLVVTSVTNPPAAAAAGASFAVSDTVRNSGTADAAASRTRYFLSLDAIKGGTDRRLGGGRSVPGLPAGSHSQAETTVSVPADVAPGSYFLIACADDTRAVTESRESNNCRASSTAMAVSP
jgi:hypothetical protein